MVIKSLRQRWIILKNDALYSYKTQSSIIDKPTEIINLHKCEKVITTANKNEFILIFTEQAPRTFVASSTEDMNDWIKSINSVINNTSNNASDSTLKSSINPNQYAAKLKTDGILLQPQQYHNHQYEQIFNTHSPSICCCVMADKIIMPSINFQSRHNIYFQYKIHKLKQEEKSETRINDYETETCYAYYPIIIKYQQLATIDRYLKQNSQFFAESYPKRLVILYFHCYNFYISIFVKVSSFMISFAGDRKSPRCKIAANI